MTKTECMKRIVELQEKLGPKTLLGLHTVGTEFMGMKTMLIQFTNEAAMYLEADDSKTPTAYLTPGKKFIPMDSLEMMNATFINENDMRDVLTLEDAIILESIALFLDDNCVDRVQMVIDKKHEFLNYMDNDALMFKNMIILRR